MGLTQPKLGKRALGSETDKSTISRIENGKVPNPQETTVKAIADVLKISDDLIENCRYPDETVVPKQVLDSLAVRFGYSNPDGDADLVLSYLHKASEDMRALQERIEELDNKKIDSRKTENRANEALAVGNFELADKELEILETVQKNDRTVPEIWTLAQIRFERGRTALLALDFPRAMQHFSAAVDYFSAFDVNRAAQTAYDAGLVMNNHGVRYGVDLLEDAIAMTTRSKGIWTKEANFRKWAGVMNLSGTIFLDHAMRKQGSDKGDFLQKSIGDFNLSLSFREKVHDADWAIVRNNLGVAFRETSEEEVGADKRVSLQKSYTALADALSVFKKPTNPDSWAIANFNMGYTQQLRAVATGGAEGLLFAREAEKHLNRCQSVFKKESHSTQWAQANGIVALVYGFKSSVTTDERDDLMRTAHFKIDDAIEAIDPALAPYLLREAQLQKKSLS